MPNFNTRKNITKRDVNFFAEFTASSRRMAKMFGYAIIVGVCAIAITVAVCVGKIIRNAGVQSDIDRINTKINSPEYLALSVDAKQLSVDYEAKTQQYYALTDMRAYVDRQPVAEMSLTDLLEKNIPNDVMILNYKIENGNFDITGYAINYSRASEIVHLLQDQADVFSNVSIKTQRYFPESPSVESLISSSIQNYYQFTISGYLVESRYVSVKRFATVDETSIALKGIETYEVAGGVNAQDIEIGELNLGGTKYTPINILVNGVAVSDVIFENAVSQGIYSVPVLNDNVEVEIDYEPVVEQPAAENTEGAEGGN